MVKNGWTEKVARQREEIERLQATVRHKSNLIDAMRIALKAREKLIENTLNELTQEKKANQSWHEFAHHACMELKKWREIAEENDPDDGSVWYGTIEDVAENKEEKGGS